MTTEATTAIRPRQETRTASEGERTASRVAMGRLSTLAHTVRRPMSLSHADGRRVKYCYCRGPRDIYTVGVLVMARMDRIIEIQKKSVTRRQLRRRGRDVDQG